jgi:hypothetical protein
MEVTATTEALGLGGVHLERVALVALAHFDAVLTNLPSTGRSVSLASAPWNFTLSHRTTAIVAISQIRK